jgi:glycosyltransferase involved in cell wall biosynthesis
MRVVILYNSSWYVFLLRRNLVLSLRALGHEVTVIAPVDRYTERVKQMGVSFLPIAIDGAGRSPVGEVRTLRSINRALKTARPHAVLSFTVKCNLYAGLCRRFMDFKHIANVSGLGELFDLNSRLKRAAELLYRIALGRTNVVFFQNEQDKDLLVSNGAVERARSRVIPGSGVDLERFTADLRMPSSQRTFLMFGRLLPKKGFDHFINAAREVRQRLGDDVAFWIMGAADPQRAESLELLERVNGAHAEGIIRYLQSTDDPLPTIKESDVVVLPSTYNEGIPRSLLEALACGKPVITTDWKGCRETVEDGRNGFLVKPNDTKSLVAAFEAVAKKEADELLLMGRNSRELAERRFDERVVLDAYLGALGEE